MVDICVCWGGEGEGVKCEGVERRKKEKQVKKTQVNK
jgi:hypothetical protein